MYSILDASYLKCSRIYRTTVPNIQPPSRRRRRGRPRPLLRCCIVILLETNFGRRRRIFSLADIRTLVHIQGTLYCPEEQIRRHSLCRKSPVTRTESRLLLVLETPTVYAFVYVVVPTVHFGSAGRVWGRRCVWSGRTPWFGHGQSSGSRQTIIDDWVRPLAARRPKPGNSVFLNAVHFEKCARRNPAEFPAKVVFCFQHALPPRITMKGFLCWRLR